MQHNRQTTAPVVVTQNVAIQHRHDDLFDVYFGGRHIGYVTYTYSAMSTHSKWTANDGDCGILRSGFASPEAAAEFMDDAWDSTSCRFRIAEAQS